MVNNKVKYFLVIFFSVFAQAVFSQTIHLKNGKVLNGAIIERTSEYIRVNFNGVPLKYYLEDIAAINEDAPASDLLIEEKTASNDKEFSEGLKFISQQRYWEAIEILKKAVDINPIDSKAMYNVASTYFMLGSYDDAIEWYKKALTIDDKYVNAYIGLGLAYRFVVKYPDSINFLQKAIDIEPNNVLALTEMGLCYQMMEEYDLAAKWYEKVVNINPNNDKVYHFLGMTYGRIGDWQKAIESFKAAISINPYYADAYFFLGTTIASWETTKARENSVVADFNKALPALEKAKELYGNDDNAEQLQKVDDFIVRITGGGE